MDVEWIVRTVLRLWLAGAVTLGFWLIAIGPFLLASVGFGGWVLLHSETTDKPRLAESESTTPSRFTLR